MEQQFGGSAARDIRGGRLRAELETLEQRAEKAERERDAARQALAAACAQLGKPPEPMPAEFDDAWKMAMMRDITPVTLPDGSTHVLWGDAVRKSGKTAAEAWPDFCRRGA